MLRYTIIIGLAVALSAGSILAQAKAPDAEKPATVKADKPVADKAPVKKTSDALKVTVVSVSGIAEQRSAKEENAKWTAIKPGDVLTELTLIRTGLGGKVVLKLSDRGLVTVKSGTKIGIASFSRQGNLVKTRLGLKYGAIRARVDSTQGANDFRVRTAVGTLAATGTGGDTAQSGDFGAQFKGTRGSWILTSGNRKRSLKPGERINGNMDKPLSFLIKKHDVKIGDLHGLTKLETKNLALNKSGNGAFVSNTKGSSTPRMILYPKQVSPLIILNIPPPVGGTGPVGGGDPTPGEEQRRYPPQ